MSTAVEHRDAARAPDPSETRPQEQAPAGEAALPASGRLRAALERSLASGLPAVNRLSYARTSVCLRVRGDHESVTLLLDRTPPLLANGTEPAEIVIELTDEQADRFAHGLLPMPAAVVSGVVTTHGPVRKYLEVDPILRGLLARSANGSAAELLETPVSPGPAASREAGIDPDLLAIETRQLEKSFGPHRVLAGVDLTIPEGVISVVLGPSGTGKSVLLKHVIGLLAPDAGEVLIRGRPLSRMSRSEILALRTEIGVMFQDGALFSTMNIYDNVAFPLRQHTDLEEREIREVVLEHLRGVGLADAAHKRPSELSGGMRKRAGLARALVLEPSILLCDEPDSGLDPVRTSLLGDLLVEQHAEYGGTVLVVTHNVALAKRIADHISVLWRGRVVESGMIEQVLNTDSAFVRQFLEGEVEGPLGMDA